MGFNCNGFSIKLVKIAQDSEIRYLFAINSRVDNSWKVTWEAHVGIWTVFCQIVFRKSLTLGQLVSDLQNSLPE